MTEHAVASILVLDPRLRSSLAACRALGRAGLYRIGVAGYESDRLDAGPAAVSRYVDRFDTLPDPAGPADPFREALWRLVRRRGYDAVLATSDATLARLASVGCPVPTFPDVGTGFLALTDKLGLVDLCEKAKVPYPRTYAPAGELEARQAVADLGPPVVVKSVRSGDAGPDAVSVALGATICRDVNATVAAVLQLLSIGSRPIVQSRIRSAEKLNAAIIRRSGVSELRYAHRVLREAPIEGGIGVALETIPAEGGPGGEAVNLLERVCEGAGYEGVAQAEFYRSSDDGRLYLLDVNPRLWGSTSFAEGLGLRFVERGVRFALGMSTLPATPYRAGKRFHTPVGEWRWLRERDDKVAALVALARSTRPWDTFEYVDWRDPFPVAAYALYLVRPRAAGATSGDGL